MKKIGIIGTVGVPAKYGGFETLVENIIGKYCSADIQYTIYCSSKTYKILISQYKGAHLTYIPLNANGIQSIFYDIFSLIKAASKNDTIVILGISGCSFLPLFRLFCNKKLIINIDGLEHKRNKWNKWTKKFLLFSEKMAIKHGDIIIADNKGIQDYVFAKYSQKTELIAYGGDHVIRNTPKNIQENILDKYNIKSNKYCFSVCRIEPENNVHMILEAFDEAHKELLFIGNWERSEYGKSLYLKYINHPLIKLLSPIYDLTTLFTLRSHCKYYIHGHSAGGTNPSLVEAMFFAKPIFAFDIVYNRETTENKASYFSSVTELINLLKLPQSKHLTNCANMIEIAQRKYLWAIIAHKYETLYRKEKLP